MSLFLIQQDMSPVFPKLGVIYKFCNTAPHELILVHQSQFYGHLRMPAGLIFYCYFRLAPVIPDHLSKSRFMNVKIETKKNTPI